MDVLSEIKSYVERLGRRCSYYELRECFVGRLGYRDGAVTKIVMYLMDVVVHSKASKWVVNYS